MSEFKYNCEGMARRDFIQLGIGSVLGFGMVDLMRLQAHTATPISGKVDPSNMRCILIWMDGGPSHFETFDPKPDAPSRINFGVKAIKTKSPDLMFAEFCPKLATVADKVSIIRSVSHGDSFSRRRQPLDDDRAEVADAYAVQFGHFVSPVIRFGGVFYERRRNEATRVHGRRPAIPFRRT